MRKLLSGRSVTSVLGLLTLGTLVYLNTIPSKTIDGLVRAGWKSEAGCNCSVSTNNRSCSLNSDGDCTGGWVFECVTAGGVMGSCHDAGSSGCLPAAPVTWCGFIDDQVCF
jgi:hypothetical protein